MTWHPDNLIEGQWYELRDGHGWKVTGVFRRLTRGRFAGRRRLFIALAPDETSGASLMVPVFNIHAVRQIERPERPRTAA